MNFEWWMAPVGVALLILFFWFVALIIEIVKMNVAPCYAITAVESTSPTYKKGFALFPKQMVNGGTLWLEWGYRVYDHCFWFRENPDTEKEQ